MAANLLCRTYTYPEASKILLSSRENEYSSLLERLLKNSFFRNIENTSIKFISEATNTKRDKATKWIKQIYDDIFLLTHIAAKLFISGRFRGYLLTMKN